MSLQVITIDFWNTIFDSSNGLERNAIRLRAFKKGVEELGIEFNENSFNKAIQASWEYFNKHWKNDYRTPSTKETIEFFCDYLKIPKNENFIDYLVKIFSESVLMAPPKLIEGVSESLLHLSKSYSLGLISDTGFSPGTILRKLLERNNIIEYFSSFSFSDETGVSKPHPKAYLNILNHLYCQPQNSLHIGDIEETDIVGAKNLGMKAIRFQGDNTTMFQRSKSIQSIADAQCTSWSEIVETILKLNE